MWCFQVILFLFNISFIFAQSYPLLLLVSFDGFRHDYPQIYGPLKNFNRLAQRGVRARNMISAFSTTTFANHYSLVTGLYEEIHGVISNEMFDRKLNLTFEPPYTSKEINWWPYPAIWSVNEQRKGARSGVGSWPQENIVIFKYENYNVSRSFRDIIDQTIRWFIDPIEPINFGAIYYREPDCAGHRFGPYSKNTAETVRECDEHLGYLLDQIDANAKLRKNLHLIVTSDHGMEQINGTNNPIYFEDYIDGTKVKNYGAPTIKNIFVQSPSDIEEAKRNLSKIPHAIVYRREDIPDRYHYKHHERIGDLLLLVEPGYEVVDRPRPGKKPRNYSLIHGNHGYDNQLDSMKGIFYAVGPQFKENFILDNSSLLYNIDIFNLMCIILNIDQCPPSNGTLTNIQPFLKIKRSIIDTLVYVIVLIGFVLIALLGISYPLTSISKIWKKRFSRPVECETQNSVPFLTHV